MTTAGERFAQALGRKDQDALRELLADPIDFQALTPGRHWQAATGRQVAEEIILGHWFDAGDDIRELCSVATGLLPHRRPAHHLDAGAVLGLPGARGGRRPDRSRRCWPRSELTR